MNTITCRPRRLDCYVIHYVELESKFIQVWFDRKMQSYNDPSCKQTTKTFDILNIKIVLLTVHIKDIATYKSRYKWIQS